MHHDADNHFSTTMCNSYNENRIYVKITFTYCTHVNYDFREYALNTQSIDYFHICGTLVHLLLEIIEIVKCVGQFNLEKRRRNIWILKVAETNIQICDIKWRLYNVIIIRLEAKKSCSSVKLIHWTLGRIMTLDL